MFGLRIRSEIRFGFLDLVEAQFSPYGPQLPGRAAPWLVIALDWRRQLGIPIQGVRVLDPIDGSTVALRPAAMATPVTVAGVLPPTGLSHCLPISLRTQVSTAALDWG